MVEVIASATTSEFWNKVWEFGTSPEILNLLQMVCALCFVFQIVLKLLNWMWGVLRRAWGKVLAFFASTGIVGGSVAVTVATPFIGDEIAVGAIWLISTTLSAIFSGITVFFLLSRRDELDGGYGAEG